MIDLKSRSRIGWRIYKDLKLRRERKRRRKEGGSYIVYISQMLSSGGSFVQTVTLAYPNSQKEHFKNYEIIKELLDLMLLNKEIYHLIRQ